MEKKLTLDRKEQSVAVFVDDESRVYNIDISSMPSYLREGDICVVSFDDEGAPISFEHCADETKNKKAEMKARLFGLFKNNK